MTEARPSAGVPGTECAAPPLDRLHQVELASLLGMPLTPCTEAGQYHNQHFRGRSSSGAPVFVKLLDDLGYWRRAVRAGPLVESVGGRTPRLLDYGELGQDRWWLVYEWCQMEEFTPTATNIEAAGELLGQLHHATSGLHLDQDFERYDLRNEIEKRATTLEVLDPVAAERVRATLDCWAPVQVPD